MFRKVIAAIVILPLLIVPFFCSCAPKAEAEPDTAVGEEQCHHDEDANSSKHDEHGHACQCDHSLNAVLENSTTVHLNSLLLKNFFPSVAAIDLRHVVRPKESMFIAYLGPPSDKVSSRLYIQHHSLRL